MSAIVKELEDEGFIRKARARRPVVVSTAPTARAGWIVESLDDIVAMVADARLHVEQSLAPQLGRKVSTWTGH